MGWNSAAAPTFGWSAEEALGRHISDLYAATIPGGSREAALKQIQAAGWWEGEVHYQRKDGAYFLACVKTTARCACSGGYPNNSS